MSYPSEHLYCTNHPTRTTWLRCNRCEKPICMKCAVLTPTGYRCKECVRGQQKVFETSQAIDYPIAFFIAIVLAFLGSLILPRWLLLAIIGGPIAGNIIAEAVRLAVRRRRSKKLSQITAVATALGCLPAILINLVAIGISLMKFGLPGEGLIVALISSVIYAVLASSTTFYRLNGISLRV